MEAALDEFAERGFAGAKIRDICAKAGTNLASVNYHFHGKQELYRKVLDHIFEMRDPLDDAAEKIAAGANPREAVRVFIESFIAAASSPENPLFKHRFKIMLRELADPSPFLPELARGKIRPKLMRLQKILGDMSGGALSGTELTVKTMMLLGQCVFFFNRPLMTALTGSESFLKDNSAVVTDIVAAGLAARAGKTQEGKE
jgi:AcrR family transcriptional regulator